VLSFGEELHIVDHIAFLAQLEEGVRTVPAASVEERVRDELTIRLAGYQTPSEEGLRELKGILGIVEGYAIKGLH
jgi:hypothetical protein